VPLQQQQQQQLCVGSDDVAMSTALDAALSTRVTDNNNSSRMPFAPTS